MDIKEEFKNGFTEEKLVEKREELTDEEIEKSLEPQGEEKLARDPSTPPRYHVVHHGDAGIEQHSFHTKRELTKHLKPVRPESIVAMFRGSKLHATIQTEYQIL